MYKIHKKEQKMHKTSAPCLEMTLVRVVRLNQKRNVLHCETETVP